MARRKQPREHDRHGEERSVAADLNSALRFALELSVLAAVIHGSVALVGGATGWLLAVGGALLASFVWVNFVNPEGVKTPGDPWRLLLEVAIFGLAAALLFEAGRTALGAVFSALAASHLAATFLLDQRGVAPREGDGD